MSVVTKCEKCGGIVILAFSGFYNEETKSFNTELPDCWKKDKQCKCGEYTKFPEK